MKAELLKAEHSLGERLSVLELSPDETSAILNAHVVLLPLGAPMPSGPVEFPEHSVDFFRYLKKNLPSEVSLEAAAGPDGLTEKVAHADQVTLPMLLLDKVVLSIVIPLIVNYIWMRYMRHKESASQQPSVRIRLIVANDNMLDFEGPLDKLEPALGILAKQGGTIGDVTHLLEDDSGEDDG